MANKKIGLILGNEEEINGKFGDNMNALIVAPPGGGKTYSVVTPNIVKNNGCSMFIDDKKGNLYHKHKKQLEAEGYKVYCFNLINFKGNLHYNPFDMIKTRDDIHKMVNVIIPDEKIGYDSYWIDTARELLEAIMDILRITDKPFTFESVIDLVHKTGTKFRMINNSEEAVEDYIDKLIDALKILNKKCKGMDRYKSLRQNAPDTWRCIRSSCIAALSVYDSDSLFKITDRTTMDFSKMATEKVALFVTSSDINGAYAPMVQFMYRDIVHRLIEMADNDYRKKNSMLPQHVRFILDDFASGTVMNGFERIIANCRSRNISFLICIQSLTQLEGLYNEMTNSVLDCFNYRVYFSSANLSTQRYLSAIMNLPLCDIQEFKQDDICIEQINQIPRMGKRYPADILFARRKRKVK